MRDFDFFSEEAAQNAPGRGEQNFDNLQRSRRKLQQHAVLIGIVCLVMAYLVWGVRDTLVYNFASKPRVELGNVDEVEEGKWPDNQWVAITGIAEAKAAQVKWIRGLEWRKAYWYYHLLGSPVFVEVPADLARTGVVEPFERVKLDGRLIDLKSAPEYDRLMEFLEQKLLMRVPEHAYMIQVGVVPDGGRRAVVFLAAAMLLPAINIALWLRAFRRLRIRTRALAAAKN